MEHEKRGVKMFSVLSTKYKVLPETSFTTLQPSWTASGHINACVQSNLIRQKYLKYFLTLSKLWCYRAFHPSIFSLLEIQEVLLLDKIHNLSSLIWDRAPPRQSARQHFNQMAGSSQSEGEATPLQASSRCLACYPTSKAEPSDPTEEFILAACIHNLILSVTTMSSWPQVGIGVDLDLIVNPKHHHPAKILLQSPPWWPDTPLAPPSHRLKTLYNMPELGDLGEQPRGGHLFFYHLEVNDHLWSYRTHPQIWLRDSLSAVSLCNSFAGQ